MQWSLTKAFALVITPELPFIAKHPVGSPPDDDTTTKTKASELFVVKINLVITQRTLQALLGWQPFFLQYSSPLFRFLVNISLDKRTAYMLWVDSERSLDIKRTYYSSF